jgi:putative ABC transport system permease protein
MFSLSLAQLRLHTSRLVATCLAIVIAVAFIVATLVLNQTTKSTVFSAIGAQYQNTDVVVSNNDLADSDSLTAHPEVIKKLRDLPGVAAVATERGTFHQVRLPEHRGYQYAEVSAVAEDKVLQWQKLSAGRLPTGPGEVAIDAATEVAVGTKLPMLIDSEEADPEAAEASSRKPTPVTVVGTVDLRGVIRVGSTTLFATPQQVLAWGGETIDALRVAGTPGTDAQALSAQVRTALDAGGGEGFSVRTGTEKAEELASDYTGDAAELTTMLLVFATVAVLVCGLVIANTFAVLLAQRTRELALLRCVGATGRQLRRGVLIESLVIGTFASLLGVGVGIGMAAGVGAIADQVDSPVPLAGLSVPPSAVLIGMAVGIVVTVLAAFAPARRATRVAPLAALRPMDAAPARSRAGLLRRGAGVLLMIPSALVLGLGASAGELLIALAGGVFSFLAVILLSQWLVPPVIALVGRVGGQAGGVPGRLAASNALRNPQRTAATATALIIGVTLTATMVVGAASTRATASSMLDRAFPTDISVTSPETAVRNSDTTVNKGLPAGLERSLAAVPNVTAMMPLTSAAVTVKGKPDSRLTGYGIDPALAAPVVRSEAGAGVPAPGTVNVPESSGDDWGKEGERIAVTSGGRSIDLRVHIVSVDTPLALTTTDLARIAPRATKSVLWIRLADGLDKDARQKAFDTITDTAADLAPNSYVQSSTEERDNFDQMIDALLMVVTALLGVAVVIALIGVGNTIALSVLERRQESGLLRALGLTRVQLRWMLLWEAVLIAGVASLLGLILGAVYGVLGTSAALSKEGTLTLALPWGQLLLILTVATVAGALASVLPSRRAARTSPVAAIAS